MAPGQGWLPVSVQRRLSGSLCDRERWSNVGFERVMDESHTGQREGGRERSDTWKCFWRAPGWVQLQRKHPSTPSYILIFPCPSTSFRSLALGCGDGQSQVVASRLPVLGREVEVLLLPFTMCFLFFSCLQASKQKAVEFPRCCRFLIF